MKFEKLILWMFSPAGKLLWRAIENPDDWDERVEGNPGIRVVHTPTRVHWWIGTFGFGFDAHYDHAGCLNYVERHFLYPKMMRMLREKRKREDRDLTKNEIVTNALLQALMGDK
jgi:hypothetical protein